MRLEDQRGAKVGDVVLLAPDGSQISAAFHHHASQACWHTLSCLLRFAGEPVNGTASEPIAAVEWWRTIESLVALLYLVALGESDAGGRPALPRLTADTFGEKWAAMAGWFSGGSDSPPSTTTRIVNELRDFRNSFEHSSRNATINVRFSRLGARPAEANLADAMEALAICVLACGYVRFALRGLDVMPQVFVPSRQLGLFYAPLDRLAIELAFPIYSDLVLKAGLTTAVAPYSSAHTLRGESAQRFSTAIKAVPDGADVRVPVSYPIWATLESFASKQPNAAAASDWGCRTIRARRSRVRPSDTPSHEPIHPASAAFPADPQSAQGVRESACWRGRSQDDSFAGLVADDSCPPRVGRGIETSLHRVAQRA